MDKKITYGDLITELSERTGYAKKVTDEVFKAYKDIVTDCVTEGDKIVIPGFMTISTRGVAARKGRNVATGEIIEIPARTNVSIKAGKTLKDAANQ